MPNEWQSTGRISEEPFMEIKLVEHRVEFLKGLSAKTIDVPPVQIIKDPEGPLATAALMQSAASRESCLQQVLLSDHDIYPHSGLSNQYYPKRKKKSKKGQVFDDETYLTIVEKRKQLPIYQLRDDLIRAISDNQILIVIGETGSGKTTQLTQYLYERDFGKAGKIACTQPRRIAAMSAAKKVAEEMRCDVGDQVGYTIRFEDITSSKTVIKYMTDGKFVFQIVNQITQFVVCFFFLSGMLLRECLLDPNLKSYSVIILDEAHERTTHTDVLIGLLKQTVQRRRELKLVVTSATLDATKFSEYFFDAPIFRIPGRTFPVEIVYLAEPEPDYFQASVDKVIDIHLNEPPGDILLFLTGQSEIDSACESLYLSVQSFGKNY